VCDTQVRALEGDDGGVTGCEGGDGIEQGASMAARGAERDDEDEAMVGDENFSAQGAEGGSGPIGGIVKKKCKRSTRMNRGQRQAMAKFELAGSLGPTPGPPLLSRLTFRSPLYIVCASFSPGRPQNLSPEFLPCPRPLLAAVGDAVPSARQCPRPWLALYETLSRARAAGLHPSFQPRS